MPEAALTQGQQRGYLLGRLRADRLEVFALKGVDQDVGNAADFRRGEAEAKSKEEGYSARAQRARQPCCEAPRPPVQTRPDEIRVELREVLLLYAQQLLRNLVLEGLLILLLCLCGAARPGNCDGV